MHFRAKTDTSLAWSSVRAVLSTPCFDNFDRSIITLDWKCHSKNVLARLDHFQHIPDTTLLFSNINLSFNWELFGKFGFDHSRRTIEKPVDHFMERSRIWRNFAMSSRRLLAFSMAAELSPHKLRGGPTKGRSFKHRQHDLRILYQQKIYVKVLIFKK